MIVSELLNSIKGSGDYVNGSLVVKEENITGIIYKWLEKNILLNIAHSKEMFIELNPLESNLKIENKTVINFINIYPTSV